MWLLGCNQLRPISYTSKAVKDTAVLKEIDQETLPSEFLAAMHLLASEQGSFFMCYYEHSFDNEEVNQDEMMELNRKQLINHPVMFIYINSLLMGGEAQFILQSLRKQ